MVSDLNFKNMELVQVLVSASKDIIVYAAFAGFSTLCRFCVAHDGRVLGESHGSWLELTAESSRQVRCMVKRTQFDKNIPVYFEGACAEN